MKNTKNLAKRSLALLLVLVMCLGLVNVSAFAEADQSESRKADDPTYNTAPEFTEDNIGYVWSDKTVEEAADDDTGFDVSYSLLSSGLTITDEVPAPLDVVFIVDVSGSMTKSSRMVNSTKALNSTMKYLMGDENNRASVVIFGTEAYTMLPLDYYEPDKDSEFFSFSGTSTGNFSVNTNVESVKNVTGYTRSHSVNGDGTNTQAGLVLGMSILANRDDTTVKISGQNVTRTPVVILLSDGNPTYSLSSAQWWDGGYNSLGSNPKQIVEPGKNGNGARMYGMAGHALKAMLSAHYLKNRIAATYGTEANFYTVGLGIDKLSQEEIGNSTDIGAYQGYFVAKAVLDPKNGLFNPDESFTYGGKTIKSDLIKQGTNDNSLLHDFKVFVEQGKIHTRINTGTGDSKFYTSTSMPNGFFNIPMGEGKYDAALQTLAAYVDGYYDVKDGSVADLTNSLKAVIKTVDGKTAPVKDKVVFTDVLGKYMVYEGIESVSWNGTPYYGNTLPHEPVTSPVDNNTHYLDEIKVTPGTNENGQVTVTITVPKELVPLVMFQKTTPADEKASRDDSVGVSAPLKITYRVKLDSRVLNADGTLNPEKVDADYIDSHADGDQGVYFLSNDYNEDTGEIGVSTTFTPSDSNEFYKDKTGGTEEKTPNTTETAGTYYEESKDDDGVRVKHGNNGKLTADLPEPEENNEKDVESGDGRGNGDMVAHVDPKTGAYNTLTYTIKYFNDTNKIADVIITDDVPAHTTYVSGGTYAPGGEYGKGVVTWTIPDVKPYKGGSVSFTVQLDKDAWEYDIENTASVKVGNNPSVSTNTTHNSTPHKDVYENTTNAANKSNSIDGEWVKPGAELTYRIDWRVPNLLNEDGTKKTYTVTITDAAPHGTSFVIAGIGNSNVTNAPDADANGEITWVISAKSGDSGYVTFTVKVLEDGNKDATNRIPNTAEVQVGSNPAIQTNEVENFVPRGDQVKDVIDPVTKESINGSTVKNGDTLRYVINWVNKSDKTLDKVTITDRIPEGTIYVGKSAKGVMTVVDDNEDKDLSSTAPEELEDLDDEHDLPNDENPPEIETEGGEIVKPTEPETTEPETTEPETTEPETTEQETTEQETTEQETTEQETTEPETTDDGGDNYSADRAPIMPMEKVMADGLYTEGAVDGEGEGDNQGVEDDNQGAEGDNQGAEGDNQGAEGGSQDTGNEGSGDSDIIYVDPVDGELTWVFENVPAGALITVEFEVMVKVSEDACLENSAEITIGDNDPEITNTTHNTVYPRGSLTINKNVLAPEYSEKLLNGTYLFHVVSADANVDMYVSLQTSVGEDGIGKGSVTIKNLPYGTYTVTEEGADQEGYTLEVNGKVSERTIYVDNPDASVTVDNKYTPYGDLTINKVIVGGPSSARNKEYTFTITDEEGNTQTKSVKGARSVTFENLKPGRYTITEANAKISGYTWKYTISSDVVEIAAGDDKSVTVTNIYDEIYYPPDDDNSTIPDEDPPLSDIPDEDPPLAELPDEDPPLAELPDEDPPLAELPDEDVPLVDLPDDDVPLAPAEPENVTIKDDDVPLARVPKTGDESAVWFYLAILSGASLLCLAVVELKKFRKN